MTDSTSLVRLVLCTSLSVSVVASEKLSSAFLPLRKTTFAAAVAVHAAAATVDVVAAVETG